MKRHVEMVDHLSEQVVPGVPTIDTMITIGIDQLSEILISLYQSLHLLC